jgi:hypothetical protein
MKSVLAAFAVCIVLVSTGVCGQSAQADASLEQASSRFADAMNRRDFATVAAQTNPKIVAVVGGEAALAEAIRASMQGLAFSDVRFKTREKDCERLALEVVCVLPYSSRLSVNDETYLFESFYLASRDCLKNHCGTVCRVS